MENLQYNFNKFNATKLVLINCFYILNIRKEEIENFNLNKYSLATKNKKYIFR